MSAIDMKHHLAELQAERALAHLDELGGDRAYAADLDDEIAAVTKAYICVAVTEIALLRAWLSGTLRG
jgi:hypothetical protein